MGMQRFIQLVIYLCFDWFDNAVIEIDASGLILDGSAKLFVDLIKEAEPVDLTEDRKFLKFKNFR